MIGELRRDIKRYKIRTIFLALPQKNIDAVLNVLLFCHGLPVKVKAMPGQYDFLLVNSSKNIHSKLVDVTLSSKSLFDTVVKRVFDICFALFGFIVTSPFWIIIPFVILLDSRGNIIYRQTRTSLFNKSFVLYKFRTMKIGAEKAGPVITNNKNDSRITIIGK